MVTSTLLPFNEELVISNLPFAPSSWTVGLASLNFMPAGSSIEALKVVSILSTLIPAATAPLN